jgi:hypothetical protein
MEEIEEEQEYLKNVEAISHQDERNNCGSDCKQNKNLHNNQGHLSTKDSSENGQDPHNSTIFQ